MKKIIFILILMFGLFCFTGLGYTDSLQEMTTIEKQSHKRKGKSGGVRGGGICGGGVFGGL